MAIRVYKCPLCNETTEELYWGEYPKTVRCKCGGNAEHRFGPVSFRMNWRPGYDVALDRTFESKTARDRYLEANDMSEDRASSGSGSRSMPEEKAQKMAYLDRQEQKLKRDT